MDTCLIYELHFGPAQVDNMIAKLAIQTNTALHKWLSDPLASSLGHRVAWTGVQ